MKNFITSRFFIYIVIIVVVIIAINPFFEVNNWWKSLLAIAVVCLVAEILKHLLKKSR